MGTAVSGKSTIASKLAQQLDVENVIDTDIIRAIKIVQEPENRKINTFSFTSWKNAGSEQTKENIIKGYEEYALQIAKEIEGVIRINNELGRTIIMEGVHINPDSLQSTLSRENVYPYVTSISESEHLKNIRRRTDESGQKEKLYLENMESLRTIQEHMHEKARRLDIPIINSKNINACVRRIMNDTKNGR
jgi:2-phosphoglycerate kinase